jgi:hypothetical protein
MRLTIRCSFFSSTVVAANNAISDFWIKDEDRLQSQSLSSIGEEASLMEH